MPNTTQQTARTEPAMAFRLAEPNLTLSPLTGMDRQGWLEAAKHLVQGVFRHIDGMESPILMPRQSTISYPQPDDPPHRFRSAEFEGVARTMMAAAPLIREEETLVVNGLNVRDYYAHQILRGTDPDSEGFWGRITDMTKATGRMQYQQTVEGAALAINLMQTRRQIWDRYTEAERQQVADLLSDYAHSLTIGHNWRFFNVLMLTFLKVNGYGIDEGALKDHLQHLLSFHVGDGWYVDDTNFDMYNPWGFHFYGPLWCKWYGYAHEPELAAVIEARNREFMKGWQRCFSRDARQLMWGRSIIYRCAASTAFGAHFLMPDPVIDPGFARRLASGNLLQFLTREDLYINALPCLGYYGPFDPLIQFYSCSASPFWLAKIFVALSLPEDSPFWTATENEGFWADLGDRSETVEIPGPGIQIVNHGRTGTTEFRTGKVFLHEPYYNQLQFNPHFSLESETAEGSNAANYSIREHGLGTGFRIPLNIAFNKFEDGILYRQMNTQPVGLGDPNKGGVNRGPERIDLADIIIPGGVIRVDRVRVPYRYELQLGHFALPHPEGTAAVVTEGNVQGYDCLEASIEGRKLALVAVHGWDSIKSARHQNLNPEARESTVLYAERIRTQDYCGIEVFITVLLHRLDNGNWPEDELMPVSAFKILPLAPSGQPCGVALTLKDGREFTIDYGNLDGRRII
jgi:hypothetical protein